MFQKQITTACFLNMTTRLWSPKYIQEILYIATRCIKVASILAEEGDGQILTDIVIEKNNQKEIATSSPTHTNLSPKTLRAFLAVPLQCDNSSGCTYLC
jgi:hypothetical protein